mmetsp:Transcript_20469/g.44333  ORF Transcript_20469/g.44333 Transcript_20469/m.44333 type:complete len:542 (+) Transcript_20469:86-1711(+)
MSLPYSAPRRDGTYKAEPGRDHPRYKETESLMMLDELEANNNDAYADENPFRAINPEELDHYHHPGQQQQPPPHSSAMVPYDDHVQPPPPRRRPPAAATPPTTAGGTEMVVYDSDEDSDDLMFDEDRDDYQPDEQFEDEGANPELEEEDYGERREWKYSTAGIKQRGVWFKYCCILIFFLLVFAVFAAISKLFAKLFEDPGPPEEPPYVQRPDNDTFARDKEFIDSVCSAGKVQQDQGLRCREYCEPQFTACCDPFPQDKAYNFTNINHALNQTSTSSEIVFTQEDFQHLNDCKAMDNMRGCNSYAKCSALKSVVGSAPVTLPYLCSEEGRERDAQSCVAACRTARCCYDENGQSCLADNYEICQDYAPCQNLRDLDRSNPDSVLPVAPADLDQQCLRKLPSCSSHCEAAKCCLDPNSRCLQENFLACTTYSACEDSSVGWNLTIPPMYSYLDQAPGELIYACNEKTYQDNQELVELIQPDSCPDYCEQVACCYQSHPQDNCFRKDPLGCMAWHHHCQREAVAVANWYIGDYQLPTPLHPN